MIRFLIVIFHFQSIITLQILEIDVRQSVMKFNLTQKKLNQTFQLKILKEETSKYLLIELFVKHQSKSSPNLVLLQSYGQAPFYDLQSPKKRILCDHYDINGQQQSKKYHYLQLNLDQNRDLLSYLTILTNKTQNYQLIFTASDIVQCPNNCSQNGQCINGKCQCIEGFIDEDCSQSAKLFIPFRMQNISIQRNAKKDCIISTQQYIYTIFNTTSNYSLSLHFESENNNKSKINIQMLVSQNYNLPCNINNNYNHTVLDQKRVEIKLLQESYMQSNFNQQSPLNLLIIKLQSEEEINYKIAIDFQIHFIEDEEEIATIILVVTFTFILIIVFILIYWYCCKKKTLNSSNIYQYQFPSLGDIHSISECPICLGNFIKTDKSLNQYAKTECQHIFHQQCLNQWREIHHTCPICRKNLI